MRYDTAEGPTKVDMGDLDHVVVNRESDVANGFKYGGYGLTAWHNPLADADDGMGDESVVNLQLHSNIKVIVRRILKNCKNISERKPSYKTK